MRLWHLPRWLVITAALCSCGGDNGPSAPGDGPSDPALPDQPNPANVTVTTDPSRMASARIPVSGGTLQATAADGTVYTLTVPANALLADTTITMTPITSVSGLDLAGGRFVGVQFEPDGLGFFRDVSFRIAPPEGARHSATGFVAHASGTEIHRYPLTPDPDQLELPLLHFSDGGVVVHNSDNPNLEPGSDILPSDPEDRLSTLLGDVWRQDRERALQGLEPDPGRDAKLQAILQSFYDEVLEPAFNTMKTDCSAARTLAPMAVRWERRVELVGQHDNFVAQEGVVHEAVVAALENCFNTTKGACLDTSDPVQMNEAAGYSRQLALFGVDDPAYNFLNPELHCSLGWTGTATSTAQFAKADGSEVTDLINADVQWEIDSANTHVGIQTQYRLKRGTITWQQTGTDQSGCTHTGGPQSFDLAPGDGAMVIDEINHTYQVTGIASHFTTSSVSCPAGKPSYTADVSLGPWLVTPVTPFPENARELSGTYEYPGLNTTFVWDFMR